MSIRMAIVLLLTLYTTRVVLSVLGVEDYGVYNVVCGFVSMFTFLSTSMSNGIQRFFNYELGKHGISGATKVYNTALLIQMTIAVVIVLFTETLGIWYLHHKMVIPVDRLVAAEWIFQFSILSFVFNIMQAPYSAAIMAHEKMDFYAIVSVLDAVLKLCIVFTVPYIAGDRLVIYGLLFLLIAISDFLLYFVYSKRKFEEIRFEKVIHKDLFKSMIGFSGWNFFGSFSGVMKEQGMNLVLNLFFGPVVNAARGVATQINGGLQSFVQNLSVPIRPQVIQSYAVENYSRCLNLTFSLSKLSCCLIYLIAMPIVLEMDYVLNLWLGENVPEHTNSFACIVILVTFVNNLNAPVSGIIHASGQMKKYQVVTSLISMMCIPGAYVALRLGTSPEVALFLIFVFSAISQYASLVILKDIIEYKLLDYLKEVLYPFFLLVFCTFAIPCIPRFLMEQSLFRFLVVGTTSVLIIIIGMYLVALNARERQLVKQLLSRIRK